MIGRVRAALVVAASLALELAACAGPAPTSPQSPVATAQPATPPQESAARPAGPPFRDCSECPLLVPLPAGSFVMGAAPGEEEREGLPRDQRGRSAPQHTVTIPRGFALGKYHVARAEFAVFQRETDRPMGSDCWVVKPGPSPSLDNPRNASWKNPGYEQTDHDPVACVLWEDAVAYAAWLSKKTGKSYRLPSEAEWEYAARAGTAGARYWGDDRNQACRYANVFDRTAYPTFSGVPRDPATSFDCSDGYVYTSPVGSFEPNAFGLHDMLGNAWQWVADCWHRSYESAPADGSPRLTGDCGFRVTRGGSWNNVAWSIRSSYRNGVPVGLRVSFYGFRVARED